MPAKHQICEDRALNMLYLYLERIQLACWLLCSCKHQIFLVLLRENNLSSYLLFALFEG